MMQFTMWRLFWSVAYIVLSIGVWLVFWLVFLHYLKGTIFFWVMLGMLYILGCGLISLWQVLRRRRWLPSFWTLGSGLVSALLGLLSLAYFAGFEVGKGIVSLILALIFLAFFLSRLIKPRVVKTEESSPSASG